MSDSSCRCFSGERERISRKASHLNAFRGGRLRRPQSHQILNSSGKSCASRIFVKHFLKGHVHFVDKKEIPWNLVLFPWTSLTSTLLLLCVCFSNLMCNLIKDLRWKSWRFFISWVYIRLGPLLYVVVLRLLRGLFHSTIKFRWYREKDTVCNSKKSNNSRRATIKDNVKIVVAKLRCVHHTHNAFRRLPEHHPLHKYLNIVFISLGHIKCTCWDKIVSVSAFTLLTFSGSIPKDGDIQ